LATVMIVSLPRFALTEVCAHTLHTKDTLLQMYTHTNTYLNLTFISSSSFPAIRRRTMSINAVDTRNIERHSYNDVNGLQPLISADLYYFKRVFLIHPLKDRTRPSHLLVFKRGSSRPSDVLCGGISRTDDNFRVS
jgi:hypothetical protein